jgi:hypothetical protein
MKTLRLSLHLLIVALLVLALSSIASAQATRTWVSGVGDDANPCSRTAPCKTFAGAISKTAINGEIDCLDPGGFGAVTITKSITIDCDQVGGILPGVTNAININAAGGTVTIRSLDLQGVGNGVNGVNIIAATAVHLVDMNIYGFTGNGVNVGVTATLALSMQNVNIHECSNGVFTSASGGGIVVSADLDRVSVWNCVNGINAQNGSRLQVHGSTFFANTNGISQTQTTTGSQVTVVNSAFSTHSGSALLSAASCSMGVATSVFTGNGTALNTGGGSIQSDGHNIVFGNAANGSATAITVI